MLADTSQPKPPNPTHDQEMRVKYYAILIGIDDYAEKPLKGCVRDVQAIKACLESQLGGLVDIQMLTASPTNNTPNPPAGKDSTLCPTHANVVASMGKCISLARAGDFIYIHYSGHGTRKPPSGEFSNTSTGDLALSLHTGGEEANGRHLWGFELATFLQRLVSKGVVATLVLDCCFAASVYRRDDPTVRFLHYQSDTESRPPLVLDQAGETREYNRSSTEDRDVSMLPNWLINPDHYAVLAACGPHEEAREPRFEGENRGALSYLLLSVIRRVGLSAKHGDIYEHLRAKFHHHGFAQNPVLYGNRHQGFFGEARCDLAAVAVPITGNGKNGSFRVHAGQAHGVTDGDEFVLFSPSAAASDPPSRREPVLAVVSRTRALTSDLEVVDRSSSSRVRAGWMASLRTRLALQKYPIRLDSGVHDWKDLTKHLDKQQLNVNTRAGNSVALFTLALKDDREYRILDSSGRDIINLPRMPQDSTSVSQVVDILKHLTQFQLVQYLFPHDASASTLRGCFKTYISHNGRAFEPGGQIEIEHDSVAELVLENEGNTDLYFFIYNLGPCWQVENVHRGTYIVVSPRSRGGLFKHTAKKKLRVRIPDQMMENGHHSCKDIVKVFVTSQPTSFDVLELPKLGGRAKGTVSDRGNTRQDDLAEYWAAVNFSICIVES
ncbi:uncharacterized protein CDV56_102438 [Aspergillus thermomutatus]|uniref:Peptidase C14 caspase domain-containing protein n=1 Tax=Aspergillus thermomutatus TaxID=41047 RepID=A0A397HLS4_ASPTH|nr:uncharacterized protein CDV56_102438 [Aspergillus thermomutatus]RHZ62536.1 hypothetical protein CDV56_102438 [Aspergillus thermomutatus]